ncbi:hypothetical protein [Thorsellia anophelis]|uniref:Uncharacterized protein n=1 Tax=Thorsellia anophelis DSM 18579 TaxID=1123402 RepID=A0A1H9Z5Z4_9GAMM|nr:hypothetical protein [Thorsellia anophelis]SES76979.1 hypothetical protein SAMN02583745_00439 [Thorsellia anophelis DSM 18579]
MKIVHLAKTAIITLIGNGIQFPEKHSKIKLLYGFLTIILATASCMHMVNAEVISSKDAPEIHGNKPVLTEDSIPYLLMPYDIGEVTKTNSEIPYSVAPNQVTISQNTDGMMIFDLDIDKPAEENAIIVNTDHPGSVIRWLNNGIALSAEQLQQPFAVSFPNGSNLTIEAHANVDLKTATGLFDFNNVMVSNTFEVTTPSYKRVIATQINPFEYAVNQTGDAFPTTGFVGATFQLVMDKPENNINYTFTVPESMQDYIAIDENGIVTFIKEFPLRTGPVTLHAEPKDGRGIAFDYTFEIKEWFINKGLGQTSDWSEAITWCTNPARGENYSLPPSAIVTNGSDTRGISSLVNEWGDISQYPLSPAWHTADGWAIDLRSDDNDRATFSLENGSVGIANGNTLEEQGSLKGVTCSRKMDSTEPREPDFKARPEIQNLKIDGQLIIGGQLDATYDFLPNGLAGKDASRYLWGAINTTAGQVKWSTFYSNDTHRIKSPILSSEDINQIYEISVLARNSAGIQAITPLTATTVALREAQKPIIKPIGIISSFEALTTATGSYQIEFGKDAIGNNLIDASEYRWVDIDGGELTAWRAMNAIANNFYTPYFILPEAQLGRKVRLAFQPITKGGLKGDQVFITSYDVVWKKPQIENLVIASGIYAPGNSLIAEYDYIDNFAGADGSLLLWGQEGTTADIIGKDFTQASGKTKANGGHISPPLTLADINTVYEVSALPETFVTLRRGTIVTTKSTDERNNITPLAPPTIENLKIETVFTNSESSLIGEYIYVPSNSVNNGDNSTWQWYTSEYESSDKEIISPRTNAFGTISTSGSVPAIILNDNDINRVIKLGMIPRDLAGITNDEVVASIPKFTRPSIENLVILPSFYLEGETTSATYTFNRGSFTQSAENGSVYSWEDKASETIRGTDGTVTTENSGNIPGFLLTRAMIGETHVLKVYPKNASNITGAEVRAESGAALGLPVITNLTIKSEYAGTYTKLSATYNYNFDAATDRSTWIWTNKTDATRNPVGVNVTGTVNVAQDSSSGVIPGFVVKPENVGDIYTLTVTPTHVNGAVNYLGKVAANSILPMKPSVKNIAIAPSNYYVGANVSASYQFDRGSWVSSAESESTYTWRVKGTTIERGVDGSISTANSGKVPGFKITAQMAGEIHTLSITPRNTAGVIGLTVTKDSATIPLPSNPKVSNINFIGGGSFFSTLSASYVYLEGNFLTGSQDISSYVFYRMDNPDEIWAQGTISNSGIIPGIVLNNPATPGVVLKLSITAKNSLGMTGNTEEASFTANWPAPDLTNLKINGNIASGQKITGSYTYQPNAWPVANAMDVTNYTWTTNRGVIDQDIVRSSGVIPEFTIQPIDAGGVIHLDAKACNIYICNSTIKRATSSTIPLVLPSVSNLKINGKLAVNEILTGTYQWNSGTRTDLADFSSYRWYVDGYNYVVPETNISISEQSGSFWVQPDFAGRTIQMGVFARNAGNLTPNTWLDVSTTVPITSPSATLSPLAYDNVKNEVSTTYIFKPGNSAAQESGSTYRWVVDGIGEISRGNITVNGIVPPATIKATHIGRTIRVYLTVKDTRGQVGNEISMTAAVNDLIVDDTTIDGFVLPSVNNLKINGLLAANQTLAGSYTWNPGSRTDIADKSLYRWSVEGFGFVVPNTEILLSGQSGSLVIQPDYVGRTILMGVYAKNAREMSPNIWQDIVTLVPITPPSATTPQLTYDDVNNVISATYTFKAGNSAAAELGSTYRWGIDGQGEIASGNIGVSGFIPGVSITASNIGQVIRTYLVVKDRRGQVGAEVTNSSTVNALIGDDTTIPGFVLPSVSNLKINGALAVGQTLTGTYSWNPGSRTDIADASLYRWWVDNYGYVITDTQITYSQQSGSLFIQPDYVGRTIRMEVYARNARNMTPDTWLQVSTLVPITPPSASQPQFAYDAANNLLNATYTFNKGNSGAAETGSTYRWVVDGIGEITNGNVGVSGTVPGLPMNASYIGRLVDVYVVVKDARGQVGTQVTNRTSINNQIGDDTTIPGFVLPSVSNLKINGALTVGQNLTGTYSWSPGSRTDIADSSLYRWSVTGYGYVIGDTNISTSGQSGSMSIQPDYAGRTITMGVYARNARNMTPNVWREVSVDVPITAPSATTPLINLEKTNWTIGATYFFIPGNSQATETGSTYEWLINGSSIQSGTITQAGQLPRFAANVSYIGKTITARIIVRDTRGLASPLISSSVAYNDLAGTDPNMPGNILPSVSNLKINGNVAVGQTVSGSYTWNPGTRTDAGDYSMAHWYVGSELRATFDPVPATQNAGTYTIKPEDAGKTLMFYVFARNTFLHAPGTWVPSASVNVPIQNFKIDGLDGGSLSWGEYGNAWDNSASASLVLVFKPDGKWGTLVNGSVSSFQGDGMYTEYGVWLPTGKNAGEFEINASVISIVDTNYGDNSGGHTVSDDWYNLGASNVALLGVFADAYTREPGSASAAYTVVAKISVRDSTSKYILSENIVSIFVSADAPNDYN